jgi:phospholipase C
MPEVTRRRLLSSAAAGAGGLLASSMLPPALARAAAEGPRRGSLKDVKHVVVHMQENRSFDHYFGTLGGVAGFGDPNALVQNDPTPPFNAVQGKSIFYQYDPYNQDSYLLPWHLDTLNTSSQAIPSTSHAWTYQHDSLNITVGGTPGAPTTALNNNWVPTHHTSDGPNNYWYVMGYYERQDIPFHFALAETFTLCDHYFCSLLGPTWPNRLYLMSAYIDPEGGNGGPIIDNEHNQLYTWKTYPEALTEAGVSWRVYQEADNFGTNVLEFFDRYANASTSSPLYQNALRTYADDRFEYDAAHDQLPTVSWILPTSYQSEHPDYTPAAGADFVASKIDAIASNPDVWAKTVFILNYDENDGLFDHVPPPTPPAGTAGEFVWGQPIGGGFRVPCIIVSPWTAGGWISGDTADHTSTLRFLEKLTGVTVPNITPWRRSTFSDLTSALGFGFAGCPPLPDTKRRLAQAVEEIETLPAPSPPNTSQSLPTQQTGFRPQRRAGVGGTR